MTKLEQFYFGIQWVGLISVTALIVFALYLYFGE